MRTTFLAIAVVCLTSPGCSRTETKGGVVPIVAPPKDRVANVHVPEVKFTDITDKAGIKFQHVSGAFGKKLLPETMGGGCAFLDFDNDGRQDVLLVNSCWWPGHEPKDQPAPTLALYRNRGDETFEDVTAAAGLGVTFYGMGVAVGDLDNDGWTDLFITAVGGNHLFRNAPGDKGSRKFIDATKTAGDLADTWDWPAAKGDEFLKLDRTVSFPSSAALLDYDKDGRLDVFVCNYITWSPQRDLTQSFTLTGLGRAYGPPTTFVGAHCQLYRNGGDGTFQNVSRPAGIEVFDEFRKPAGKSLGVAVCDLDEDGWPDLVIANDTVRNFFFHNQRNGKFRECGLECGIAYAEGTARGGMGIDVCEHRPGQCAILIGNFANEPDTLMLQNEPKRLLFTDVAAFEGLAGPSRQPLVFGVFFFDYDLDGRLDILTNNGHLEPEIARVQAGQQFRQPVQLYWNTGAAPSFELAAPDKVGPDLHKPLVGRGSALADIDGNGTLDLLLMSNGSAPRLLKNQGAGNNWLRLVLEGNGKDTNRSAIGARVAVTSGKRIMKRDVTSSKGYLSASELPLTFGLGKADKAERVEIVWPGKDAAPQVLTDLAANQVHRIRQQ